MFTSSRQDREFCETQATKLLKKMKVEKWPVRVDHLAKLQGLKVRYYPFDDELSGMIFCKGDLVVIGINSRHHVNRQRFTIAHEVGHYIMHRDVLTRGAHVDKFIRMLKRNSRSATGEISIEVQANQFAAELIMPRKLILAYMNQNDISDEGMQDEDAIYDMARAFKVSSTAMAIRIGAYQRLAE